MQATLLRASVVLLAASGLLVGTSVATAIATRSKAHVTRAVYLREYASLRSVKEGGNTLYERGHARGTFDGAIVARLRFSVSSVSATFTLYPKGGSVTGVAHASYSVKGSTGYYGGSLTITKATGAYRRVAGRNIGISGTIDRTSFRLSVKANGWIKD